ncbi:MAG: hypothetical protein Q7R68_10905 [Nitrospirales bacterium]|nr:hypothetical protein [Nitrospirales bacterium]
MPESRECGCPYPGPHTAHCLAPLDGCRPRGGDPAHDHTWIQVRAGGWLMKAVCTCKTIRRFVLQDFNRELALGKMTLLPRRA